MKLQPFSAFNGSSAQSLPSGYVAAAIHPTSVVDMCRIGSVRLGLGAVMPLGQTAPTLSPHRLAFDAGGGKYIPDEHLVLQLYEACDLLVAPAATRMPYTTTVRVANADLGHTLATAAVVARVPMSGRAGAYVVIKREGHAAGVPAGDLNIVFRAIKTGTVDDPKAKPQVTETADTWLNGATDESVTTLSGVDSVVLSRGFYVDERCDELQIALWGPDVTNSDAYLTVEASGEAS